MSNKTSQSVDDDLKRYGLIKTDYDDLRSQISGKGNQADIDSLTSSMAEKTQDIAKRLDVSRNYLTYKNVSTTVSPGSIPTTSTYQHLATQGADNTLCVMISITGDTDASPVMQTDSNVTSALSNAQSVGVKTTQIKLHIGTSYSDGYSRSNYHPDPTSFFPNWKAICLHYASLCVQNNIPVLCIGCEQKQQTTNDLTSYWQDIVNTIKAQYPNLLLTYAGVIYEVYEVDSNGVNVPRNFWSYMDYIGMNLYIRYTNKLASQNPTLAECIQGLYIKNSVTNNNLSYMEIVNSHATKFNKKVIITETGLSPFDDSLAMIYQLGETGTKYYDGTSLAMQAVFEGLCQNKNVIGFSWWHVQSPFDYYVDGSVTSAEQTMINYLKGGLI